LIISKEVGTFTAILKFLLTNYEIAHLFATISGFRQKIASQEIYISLDPIMSSILFQLLLSS
jgi:hypothetical protein